MLRLNLIAGCLLVLTACGRTANDSQNSKLESTLPIRATIIAMSGNDSCVTSPSNGNIEGPLGTDFFDKVIALGKKITERTQVTPHIIASCFTGDSNIIASDSDENFAPVKKSDEQFIKEVQGKLVESTTAHVIGHSYGGWLAMKVLESWQGPENTVKTLHTLDPISKKLCTFNNPDYCVSAPMDIFPAGRLNIKKHTGTWVNAWQSKTFFLHSSVIPEADVNPFYNVAHWIIDTHKPVWDDIQSRIIGQIVREFANSNELVENAQTE